MSALPKLVLLALHILLCWALISKASADDPSKGLSEIEKYEAQINYIVRTRLDEEKDYVHEVVTLIRRGELPRKLVDRSLSWVRDHCEDDDHCFAYFEQVLRRQAISLRFQVPAFNYDVYDSSNR